MNAGYTAVAALFQGSTANALNAISGSPANNGFSQQLAFTHDMAAGTTSATTFTVRAGPAIGNLYINGWSGGRLLGGVSFATLSIEEYAP